jgi:hypothetical protein
VPPSRYTSLTGEEKEMLSKVRELVSRLPDVHRVLLHRAVALPLITIGSSFLAGGRLIYERQTEEDRVAGFRPNRFSENG